jgi:hypothetical protein
VDQYPVVEVADWELAGVEPDGLSPNTWYREPATDELWLFKPVVSHGELRQGENWSEKLSSEIGALIGVPTATVELATLSGYPGCISLNLCPRKWEMQQGAVLLAGFVDGYRSKIKGRAGHSLGNISRALEGLSPPPDWKFPDGFGAFDVFAGYLVFDALIGNRDRHDGNWSILRPPPSGSQADALCGSYDHASSLGFNLGDVERERRVADGSVMAWAEKGTAYKFEHDVGTRPPTLVSHAVLALSLAVPEARDYWLDRVTDLRSDSVDDILASIVGMSEPAATFASQLVVINKGRLLNER